MSDWKDKVYNKAATKRHSELGSSDTVMNLRKVVTDKEWDSVLKALMSTSAPGDDDLRNKDITDSRNMGLTGACRTLVDAVSQSPRYSNAHTIIPAQCV